MAEEKSKAQKKYEEVINYLSEKKTISSPYDKKGADITKALSAKSPQEALAKLAREFYKTIGWDTSMYKEDIEILGLLATQVGKHYAEILSELDKDKPDVEEAYSKMKKAHKDIYVSRVKEIKLSEIEQMSGDDKLDIAKIVQENLPALKDKKPAEILPGLTEYIRIIAKRTYEDEQLKHAKAGEKYAQALKDKYVENQEAKGEKPEKVKEDLEKKLAKAA